MAEGQDNNIIIVKKNKKGGEGHHGGAWKVAYADFVTAMMALFIVLWVLGQSGSTGLVKTLWDSQYLYLYAIVTDKLLSKAANNAYEQDSFEVFIDQNNAKTTTYQVDDGQYRINFDNETTFNGGASPDLLTSATKITPDGYIVELAIKFDAIEPQEGMLIGFDVQVNNDENGNGIRDSVVTWNDSTHQGYQNTSGLGVLLLIR